MRLGTSRQRAERPPLIRPRKNVHFHKIFTRQDEPESQKQNTDEMCGVSSALYSEILRSVALWPIMLSPTKPRVRSAPDTVVVFFVGCCYYIVVLLVAIVIVGCCYCWLLFVVAKKR